LPQLGHSNFAEIVCGLTSDDCLTIPFKTRSLSIWLALIFLIAICWSSGIFVNLILKRFTGLGSSNCSTAISAAFIVSSGCSKSSSASSGSNLDNS